MTLKRIGVSTLVCAVACAACTGGANVDAGGGGEGEGQPGDDAGRPGEGEGEGEGEVTCLQPFQFSSPESIVPLSGAPPEPVVLNELWDRAALCAGLGVGLEGDDARTAPGDVGVFDMLMHGASQRVIVAAHHADGGNSVVLRGIAILSLATGTPVACAPVDDAGDADFPLAVFDASHVVATTGERVALGDSGHVHRIKQTIVDLATSTSVARTAELPDEATHAGITPLPVGADELVAGWDGGSRLIGVNMTAAQPLAWDRRADSVLAGAFSFGFVVEREGSVLALALGASDESVVTVSACGDVQPTAYGPVVAPPMLFDDGDAELQWTTIGDPQGNALVVNRLSGSTIEPRCHAVVQLLPDRFACLELFGAARLKSFNSAGGDRNEADLPLSEGTDTISWTTDLVAAADGFLVLTGSLQGPGGEATGTRVFVIRDDAAFTIVAEATIAPSQLNLPGSEPPLLDASGVMLVPVGGHIHGFQTNLRGLAPTSYARGPVAGGNDNRGYRQGT